MSVDENQHLLGSARGEHALQRLWEQVLAILNIGYYVFYLISQGFPCSMSVSHLQVKVQKKSVLNNNIKIFVTSLIVNESLLWIFWWVWFGSKLFFYIWPISQATFLSLCLVLLPLSSRLFHLTHLFSLFYWIHPFSILKTETALLTMITLESVNQP